VIVPVDTSHRARIAVAVTSACIVVLMASGCASVDPWNEMERTPPTPSAYYRPTAGVPSSLSPEATPGESGIAPVASPKDGNLTLAECIHTALEHNPRTRGSWQSTRAAAARVGEQRAAYLPSVDVTAETMRGKSVSLESEKEAAARTTYAGSIDVGYLLFDGGARQAGVRGAEAALLEADFIHNTTLQDVALAVEEAYYELLGAQWFLKVADETVKQTQYHVDLARARHDAGVVTRADVLKAETQRAEAELGVVRGRNGIQIAKGGLARAMGITVSSAFEIAELPEPMQREELPRTEELLDEAARQRPELQAALARIDENRAEVAAARARYWPTLGARFDAGLKDTDFPPEREEWSAGVVLSYPLFDGFERSYLVQRAQFELARAMADHAELLQGVELEVWTAYWRLIEAAEAVEAAGKFVASAEESARLAEGEYKSGVGSIIDLIDAQTTRTEARTRLVQARLDWYTAKARFERAVGRALADDGVLSPHGKVDG